MAKGDGPPVQRVVLVCGHIRRFFEPSPDGTYYCLECEEHKEVEKKLQDPRAAYGKALK